MLLPPVIVSGIPRVQYHKELILDYLEHSSKKAVG